MLVVNLLPPPLLPHGFNRIIVGHDAKIGANVVIFQGVTISHGGCVIGDNVTLGANCVVIEDIPDGATCVLNKPRIIIKN